jgi:GTPase SAR1 family protein
MPNLTLLLLGLPSSGKSALLGSLQQAAQTQGAALDGELVDLTGELSRLRQTSADERYQPTKDAIVAYPMTRHIDGHDECVTLLDTSGKQAAALLGGAEALDAKTPLPQALAEADGVLLVVDASTSKNDLAQQFRQFVTFLESWQDRRSVAAQVGGLPVFLVFAKCDKLMQPGDSVEQWKKQVNERTRSYGEQFKKALADSRDQSFGRIDVHVWATAARTPGIDKKSPPYQVDELFQDVFTKANRYQQRTERSTQTLQGALVGLGGAAALLSLLMTWYYATQPSLDEAVLEGQVQSLLVGGEESSERVREPIEDRLKELREVKANPAYEQLPSRMREQLDETERAIMAYQQLNADYQKDVRNPRMAVRDADLDQVDKALAHYDEKLRAWPDTRLAKRHQEWIAEAAALRQAVKNEEAWTRTQTQDGESLRIQGHGLIAEKAPAARKEPWFKTVQEYLIRNRRHKGIDRVEGTTIPYRVVYQFNGVAAAEQGWRQMKAKLEQLRDEAMEK